MQLSIYFTVWLIGIPVSFLLLLVFHVMPGGWGRQPDSEDLLDIMAVSLLWPMTIIVIIYGYLLAGLYEIGWAIHNLLYREKKTKAKTNA